MCNGPSSGYQPQSYQPSYQPQQFKSFGPQQYPQYGPSFGQQSYPQQQSFMTGNGFMRQGGFYDTSPMFGSPFTQQSFTTPNFTPYNPNPQQPPTQPPPQTPPPQTPPQFTVDDPRFRFDQTPNRQGGNPNFAYGSTMKQIADMGLFQKYGNDFNLLDAKELYNPQGIYIGPNANPDFQTAAAQNGVPLGFTGQRGTNQFGLPAYYINGHEFSGYGGGGNADTSFRQLFRAANPFQPNPPTFGG